MTVENAGEPVTPFLIQQYAIRKNRHLTAQAVQVQEQFFKARIGQAFASRQGRVDHTGLVGLINQIFPLIYGEKTPSMGLVLIQMDITHFTVQVAEWR